MACNGRVHHRHDADHGRAGLVNRQFKAVSPTGCGSPTSRSCGPGRGSATPRCHRRANLRKIVVWAVRRRCAPKICPYKYSIMLFGNQILIFLSWCIIPTLDRSNYRRPIPSTDWLSSGSPSSSGHVANVMTTPAVNVASKSELINRGRPWRCIDDVKLATAEWLAGTTRNACTKLLGYRSPGRVRGLTGTSHPASCSQPRPSQLTRNKAWDSSGGQCRHRGDRFGGEAADRGFALLIALDRAP